MAKQYINSTNSASGGPARRDLAKLRLGGEGGDRDQPNKSIGVYRPRLHQGPPPSGTDPGAALFTTSISFVLVVTGTNNTSSIASSTTTSIPIANW
jgi:hypothetical protein